MRWDAILKRVSDNAIIAEIGVWKAINAMNILQQNETVKLCLIDRWTPYSEKERQQEELYSISDAKNKTYKHAKRRVKEKTEPYKNRVTIHDMESIKAAELYPDDFFDLVFIDALHSYEGCLSDIKAWFSKVKNGGYIGGHDYTSHPGVKKAVDEFFFEYEIEFDSDKTWFVKI
jgi:hypothetical protein